MSRIRVYFLSLVLLLSAGHLVGAQAQTKSSPDSTELIRVRTADLVALLDSLASVQVDTLSIDRLRQVWLQQLLSGGQPVIMQGVSPQAVHVPSYDARLGLLEQFMGLPRQQGSNTHVVVVPQSHTDSLRPQQVAAQPALAPTLPEQKIDTVYLKELVTDVPQMPLQPAYVVDSLRLVEPVQIISQGQRSTGASVYFSVGSAELSPAAKKTIGEVAQLLKANPQLKLKLSAYASPEGSRVVNERLAKKRFLSVVQELMNHGIIADRLNVSPELGIDLSSSASLARRVDIKAE